ncbi:MAG: hypothetical protein QM606_06835 [Leucobacter sp.]
MTTRMGTVALVLFLACAAALTGCDSRSMVAEPAEKDASGATASEALGLTLEAQYELAGDRYRELNDRLAALQSEVFDDEWLDGSVSSEVVPGLGYALGGGLESDTRENSYYFTASRWHGSDQDLKPLVHEIARSWEARGWEVAEETSQVNGEVRAVATTDDGFWFSASEERGRLELTGDTPVYWGSQLALMEAIAERRDAETEAGATWDTADRDEKGHAYRLPGVYRPFPAWDAVPVGRDDEP